MGQTAALKRLLDTSPIGVIITRGDELCVVYANDPAASLFGETKSTLLGRTLSRLPMRHRHRASLEDALALGRGSLAGLPFHRAEGGTSWLDVSLESIGFGGSAALLWWIKDITAGRRSVRQSIAAKDMAEANLRAKAEFTGTMSHEIRTPVTGLLASARSLLETQLDARQRALAEDIRYSCKALLALVSDIIDVSRLDSGAVRITPGCFDLGRLIDSTVALVASRAREKGLELSVAIDRRLPAAVQGDDERLRQLLLNLVGNAVKYTDSGSIAIAVSLVSGDDLVIRFEIIDSGPGIPEKLRGRLFHAYAPAEPAMARRQGSTGLGLVICQKIVDLWGGRIGMEPQPGAGSRFWFELPFERAPQPAALPPLTVLVAEDNPVNQKLIAGLLGRFGHDVTVVGDGRQAVEAVQTRYFDAIFMDMQMPLMDGLEATRSIRALPPPGNRVPIIAMTANALKGDDERCLSAGMNDYLPKPVDPERMRAVLHRQIAGNLPSSALPPPVVPLDAGQITQLAELIGRDSIVELVAMFIADARERCRQLIEIAQDGDLEQMQALAHDLKSTGGSLGFTGLSRLAEAVELACREGRSGEALILIGHLDERWKDALAAAHGQVPELAGLENPVGSA